MRKAGAKDYQNYSKKILKVTKKPISFEVFADNHDEMIKQGKKISKLGKNVFVKVPYSNTNGKFSGKVIKALNSKKDEQSSPILPNLTQGQKLNLQGIENKQKYTKPPSRFSEAALVRELEKKGELKKLLEN